MKEYLLIDHPEKVLSCFSNSDVIMYVWQSKSVVDRIIFPSNVSYLDKQNNEVTLETRDSKNFKISRGAAFCYNEDLTSFFKVEITDVDRNKIKIDIPESVQVLNESESITMNECLYNIHSEYLKENNVRIKSYESQKHMVYDGPRENIDLGIMKVKGYINNRSSHDMDMLNEQISSVVLDAEDALYADQRDAPRAKPKIDKTVKFLNLNHEQITYSLYDLSMGGMSFITDNVDELDNGQEIEITGFDDKTFEEALRAIIRNIRPIEDNDGYFKIGVQFLEDEDLSSAQS